MLTRRAFLATAALPAVARAIDPIARTATPHLRLALAAYSYRKELDLKKPSMTLFDFADLTAGLGADAVELTSYYFADTTDAYLARLKWHCSRQGLDVSCVPVRNDFAQKDDAKRRADIAHVNAWSEIAAKLGAKTVRVFAGNAPKGEAEAACRARVVASLEACCGHAAKYGIGIAMENHGGLTATPEGVLAIVKAVKATNFGINVDTGNFKTADPYADVAAIAPYGINVQVKTELFPTGKPTQEADLPRVVEILKAAKYRGYVALEYEAAEDAKTAVPKYFAQLRKLLG